MLGLFLARIRRFNEQNLDAITTEAIRVRTGAVVSIFSIETATLKAICPDSVGLNCEALSAFTLSFGVIHKICMPPIVLQVS